MSETSLFTSIANVVKRIIPSWLVRRDESTSSPMPNDVKSSFSATTPSSSVAQDVSNESVSEDIYDESSMFDMDITYETDPFEPDFSQGEVEEDPFLGPRETLTKDPIKEEIKSDPNLDKNEKRRLLRKRSLQLLDLDIRKAEKKMKTEEFKKSLRKTPVDSSIVPDESVLRTSRSKSKPNSLSVPHVQFKGFINNEGSQTFFEFVFVNGTKFAVGDVTYLGRNTDRLKLGLIKKLYAHETSSAVRNMAELQLFYTKHDTDKKDDPDADEREVYLSTECIDQPIESFVFERRPVVVQRSSLPCPLPEFRAKKDTFYYSMMYDPSSNSYSPVT